MAELGTIVCTVRLKEKNAWRLKLAAWILRGYSFSVETVEGDK